MSKWSTYEEGNKPDDNVTYLAFCNDAITSWYEVLHRNKGRWMSRGVEFPCIVTHWQELPEKP